MSESQFERILVSLSSLSEEVKGIHHRLDVLNGTVADHNKQIAELRIADVKLDATVTNLNNFKNGVWSTIAKIGLPFITAVIGGVLVKLGVINF